MTTHLPARQNVSDLGPCMQELAERERIFVEAFVQGHGGRGAIRAAVIAAGYGVGSTDHVRDSLGARLLQTTRIQNAIAEITKSEYRNLLPMALKAIGDILTTNFHKDRAKVAQNLIDRIDVPTSKSEVDISVTHRVDHDAEAIAQLRSLKALGVAREKLVEVFGDFGLERIEKLAALEHQPANVIDVPFTPVTDPDDLSDL